MRKGQAALEFLTTYGWAFIVILVMIGALAYFGVLSPSKLLPTRCIFSPELQCVESMVIGNQSNNGIIKLRLRNNIGSTASFSFGATDVDNGQYVNCAAITNNGVDIKSGSIMEVNCTFAYIFPPGEKVKFEINTTYLKTGGTYSTPAKGELYSDVQ